MNLIFGKCNGKKLSEKVGIGIGERNGRNDENAGNQSGNDRNPENQGLNPGNWNGNHFSN